MRPLRLADCTRAVKRIRSRTTPLILTTSIAGSRTGAISTTGTRASVGTISSLAGPTSLSSSLHSRGYITSSTEQQPGTMASSTTIKVSTDAPGDYNVGVRPESAERASKVLQENLNKFHIYFNYQGFHSMFCLPLSWFNR